MNVPHQAIVETRLLITPVRTQLVDSYVNAQKDLLMIPQLGSVRVSTMHHSSFFKMKWFASN